MPGEAESARTYMFMACLEAPDMGMLALLDTGAEVGALASQQWLDRAGLPWLAEHEGRALALCGRKASLQAVGSIEIHLVLAGINRHGERAHLGLPPMRVTVVDAPLAPYQLLIGAQYLQKIQAEIDCARRRVTFGARDDDARLVAPLAEEQDWRATLDVLGRQTGAVDGAREVDQADRLERTTRLVQAQRRLGELGAAAMSRLERTFKARRRRLYRARQREGDSGVNETTAVDAVEGDVDPIGQTIAELTQQEQRRREQLLEDISAAELEKMHGVAREWAERVMEFGTRQFHEAAGPGEAVVRLDTAQRQELAAIFRGAARQLCAASRVPRQPRTPLPVRVRFELDPDAKPTKEGAMRTLSADRRDAAIDQVDLLEAAGLIETVTNPEWIHAIVMARKPDGRFRFAIDYRPLNRALRRHVYPLPDVDGLLRRLAQASCFSVYDLSDAFWHLELDARDRALTGFHVPGRGTFMWRVLPMGIQPATAAWQANMERVLAPLIGRGAEVFVDDIVLYADDEASLLRLTRQAHALFEEYDLRVGHRKAQLFRSEVDFLGHRIGHGRIGVLKKHSDALAAFPEPSNVQDLQRFLGLANYMRNFVPRMGDMTAPLGVMAQRATAEATQHGRAPAKERLAWGEEERAALAALRAALSSPPVLTVPDMAKLDGRLRIESDACTETEGRPGGVGGTVWWRDDNGEWRLVLAHSRVLQPAERRYAPVEVELLGVLDILRQAEWLVSKAADIEVLTDHQALTYLAKIGNINHGRHARWAARLLQHDLRLRYRPGAENVVNDALSRAPLDMLLRAGGREGEVAALAQQRMFHELDIVEQLATLPEQHFDVVFVDFPWRHDVDEVERYFRRMDNNRWPELGLTRVLRDDALVFIAAPDCLLQEAMRAVEALGLRFHRTIQWAKDKATSSRRWPRCSWEHIIIASQGHVGRVLARGANELDGCVRAATQQPGRKPEELFQVMEELTRPGARRLELFARRRRRGWLALGDQVDHFAEVAAAGEEEEEEGEDEVVATHLLHYARHPVDVEVVRRVTRGEVEDPVDATKAWLVPTREERRKAKGWCAKQKELSWRAVPVRRKSIATFLVQYPESCPLLLLRNQQEGRWEWVEWRQQEEEEAQLHVPEISTANQWVLARKDDMGKERLLGMVHDIDAAHAGVARTLARLRAANARLAEKSKAQVQEYIQLCEVCQRQRPDHPKRAHRPARLPDRPAVFGHRVHVDLFGPNRQGEYVLSCTDALTRWPMAAVIPDKTAATVADAINTHWFCMFGPPRFLVTDQGTEFENTLLKELCAVHGVEKLRTTPYHPQANGVEERAHRTIKGIMRRLADELGTQPGGWHQLLPLALRVLRSTVNRATGHSPARLVLGHDLPLVGRLFDNLSADEHTRRWLEVASQGDDEALADMDNLAKQRVLDAQAAVEQVTRQVLEVVADADGEAPPDTDRQPYPELQPGVYCRVWQGEAAAVAHDDANVALWSEPYRVVEKLRGVSVVLAAAHDPLRRTVQSCMRVKVVRLPEEEREEAEQLWTDTAEQLADSRAARREAARSAWGAKDANAEYEVDRVLDARGRGRGAELLVRWMTGEETWQSRGEMERQVPDMVKEFDRAARRDARAHESGSRRASAASGRAKSGAK